jgi:(p)ppGpp synthase/HD superfamily hydrolase
MCPALEDAIALAASAHRSQLDKGGQPYILHPLRVMLRQQDETARIVAVLHDVVEDTSVTLIGLREAGYGEEVCEAIDCLTRRHGEDYDGMLSRVETNPTARRVKLADLEDNMDPRRLESTSEGVAALRAKYKNAWDRLMAGNENTGTESMSKRTADK